MLFSLPLEHPDAPFALEISGEDYNELERILNESKAILEQNPGLYNITTSMDEGTPEVEVAIDRFKTSYYNVTVESVINQMKSYLEGSSAGSFEKDGETEGYHNQARRHFASSA
ncbi:MAG: efflux RND transporter permease subunit [Marinilabiliales bacterium]|nr:efflux RND transporter permease subunit [Marinilabiliales bacterium]